MPRTVLDKGLRDLHTQILTLAWKVEGAFTITIKAMELGKHHLLPQVIEQGAGIDTIRDAAQQQALRLLILQQPLGGQDLRFLTSALYISDNYGRVGDAVIQLARTLLEAASLYQEAVGSSLYSVEGSAVDQQGHLTDVFLLRGLLVLGQEIEHVLITTREAFMQRDVVRARTLETEQDFVELRYASICRDIMQIQAQSQSPRHIREMQPFSNASLLYSGWLIYWLRWPPISPTRANALSSLSRGSQIVFPFARRFGYISP